MVDKSNKFLSKYIRTKFVIVFFVFAISMASLLSLSALGYWYLNSNSRLNSSYSASIDYVNEGNVKVTKIEYKRLEKSEAELFRLILKYSRNLSTLEAYNLAKIIEDECEYRGLDASTVLGVIMVESNFSPKVVSNRGAMGLMQILPSTGRYMAKKEGIEFTTRNELYDPEINVRIGIAYLSYLNSRFNSIESALGAYNYGPTKFANYFVSTEEEKSLPRYVYKVLEYKNTFDNELGNIKSS